MEQLFGDFVKEKQGKEYIEVHFSPTSTPLRERWRNNSLSANFLSEYWAVFFPAQDLPPRDRQHEIKGWISYIANELLENVMKFSFKPDNNPVSMELHLFPEAFRFYTINVVNPLHVSEFQEFIGKLLTEDTQEIQLQQIEKNAADTNKDVSRLGLLTLINDYGAHLAWRFETRTDEEHPEIVTVTTMAELSI